MGKNQKKTGASLPQRKSGKQEKEGKTQIEPFEWKVHPEPTPKSFDNSKLEQDTLAILSFLSLSIPKGFFDLVERELRTVIFQNSNITTQQSAALLRWMLYHPYVEVIKENWKVTLDSKQTNHLILGKMKLYNLG